MGLVPRPVVLVASDTLRGQPAARLRRLYGQELWKLQPSGDAVLTGQSPTEHFLYQQPRPEPCRGFR